LPHTQAVAERLANLRLGPAAALGTASTEAIKTEPRAVAHTTNLLEEFTLAGKAKSEAPPDQESLSDDNDSLSEE
jgi:hypothetical protein